MLIVSLVINIRALFIKQGLKRGELFIIDKNRCY